MSNSFSTRIFKATPLKFSEIIVLLTLPSSFAVSTIDECENFLPRNDSKTISSKLYFASLTISWEDP